MSQATTKQRSRFNSRSRRAHKKAQQFQSRRLNLEALEPRTMLTGTWTPVTNLSAEWRRAVRLAVQWQRDGSAQHDLGGHTIADARCQRQLREWDLVVRGQFHNHRT